MLAILAFCVLSGAPASPPADAAASRAAVLPMVGFAEESPEQDEIAGGAALRTSTPLLHAEPHIAKRIITPRRSVLLDTMRLNI